MDPERLQRALQVVADLRSQGKSDREINSLLRRSSLQVNSLSALTQEAQVAGLVGPGSEGQEEPEGDGLGENIREGLASLTQGATGSLASDLIAQLEKVGLAREGAAGRFRGDVQEGRDEQPFVSGGFQLAGMLAGAPRAVGAAGVKVGKALAPGARKAGAAAARRLGGGELAQEAGRGIASGLLGAGAGTATGAAEGGLIGFGEAAGKPTEERLDEAVAPALLGAAIGGPIGGLTSGFSNIRRIRTLKREGGEKLADAAEQTGRLKGTRSVERQRQGIKEVAKEGFRQAEAVGTGIPGQITDLAVNSPNIQRILRSSKSQRAKDLLNRFERFRKGESIRPLSFKEADMLRKELKHQGDALARRQLGATGKVPDIFEVDEAQAVLGQIEDLLEQVPGYRQGIELTASQNAIRRAADLGEKLRSKPAQTIEDALAGQTIRLGKKTHQLGSLEEIAAFRESLAEPMIHRLRGGSSKVNSFLNEALTSSDTQRQLRVVLGSDQAVESFLQEAKRLEAVGKANRVADALIKAAGFLGAGTSLFGGALSDII